MKGTLGEPTGTVLPDAFPLLPIRGESKRTVPVGCLDGGPEHRLLTECIKSQGRKNASLRFCHVVQPSYLMPLTSTPNFLRRSVRVSGFSSRWGS